MKETVKLGLIGCGGRAHAHIAGIKECGYAQVVAVADPIRERAEEFAQIFEGARIYDSHSALYDAEGGNLDAVIICIEPTAHTDTELRAIELDLPFLIEKPMTLDLALGQRIVDLVKEKNLITAVGFQDRYQDLTDIITDEMPKHKMGGLVYGAWVGGIPGVWWWQKKAYCGGQLVEQNIHLLDELRYLFGEALSVYATASTGIVKAGENCSAEYDTDDHSTAVIRFKNNVTATLVSACYIKPGEGTRPRCGLYITLEDIIFDYRLRNNLIISDKNGVRDIPRKEDQTKTLDLAFLHAIRTGDRSGIRSDYPDAFKSLKLGFACNQSMESGQVIYFDEEEWA